MYGNIRPDLKNVRICNATLGTPDQLILLAEDVKKRINNGNLSEAYPEDLL